MSNPEDSDLTPPEESEGTQKPEGTPHSEGAPSAQPEPGGPPEPPSGQETVQLSAEEVAALAEQQHPSDPDDPLVGTLLRNKWRVLARIGAGSFGTVYKVQDVNGEWIEALKILSVDRLRGPEAENMRARFLREAQIMKKLGRLSPHIVGLSTYEDDIEAGLIYFLMEHVEGRVLSDVLLEDGPLSMDRAIRIGLQCCDAMIAAHESDPPVVHRDLKLENLMMTTDRDGEESIKVLDFGIAKLTEQEGDSRLTAQGTLGTPGYAAPEQLRAGDIDGRTDLFAFGVILYSLVTGRNPWLGHLAYQPTNQTYELMAASDRAEPIPISESGQNVPPGMIDIIMKLLKREPEDRFQSARELRDALLALSQGGIDPAFQATQKMQPTGAPAGAPTGAPAAPERRLAAVWFADLVGYSTLSSQDEELALTLLDIFHKTARREVEEGGGRIVQFIGDAAFAEFSSTQRAVKTAVDFLEAFTKDTEETGHTPQLRIGIHVGDVLMASDGDLFGDGVNVAARIQNDAEPGQILVSQDVWRQLKQRKDFGFVSVGERSLKGIGAPVHLFAVVEAGAVTTGEMAAFGDPSTAGLAYPQQKKRSTSKVAAAAIIGVLAVGGGGYAAMNMGGAEEPAPIDTGNETATLPGDQTGTDPGGDAGTDPGEEAEEPVEAETPPDDTPDEVVDNNPDPTPPPETRTDPFQEAYPGTRSRVGSIRTTAMNAGVHPSMQALFREAETHWNGAETFANSGNYELAMGELRDAEPMYQQVTSDSRDLRSVDSERSAVQDLRGNAVNQTLIDQAEAAMTSAENAVTQGRYSDAIAEFRRAATLMRDAATPEEVQVEEPAFDPGAISSDLLNRLGVAMQAENLAEVRAIRANMPQSRADSIQTFFDSFDLRSATFTAQSIETIVEGQSFDVTVAIRYDIDGTSDPAILPAEIYTIERTGSGWAIVASRRADGG